MVTDRTEIADPAERAAAVDSARRTLLAIIAGIVGLTGLYFTARNIWVAREGQVTDRYTKAIEQLGSPHLHVRVGGIYGLERIAHDSRYDHWMIIEVLCAFLRARAPREVRGMVGNHVELDVEAAAKVIFHRRTHNDPKNELVKLKGIGLSGADLTFGKLRYSFLPDMDFSHALLGGADLTGTILDRSDMHDVTLTLSNLSSSRLAGVNLRGADLEECSLRGADLSAADLTGAAMTGVDITGANLTEVCLADAILVEARGLTAEQLLAAASWERARLPKHLEALQYGGPGQRAEKPDESDAVAPGP